VRDSEARLSGPTHLRMCIRVSAQAGPARSRCCGPARGPWAALPLQAGRRRLRGAARLGAGASRRVVDAWRRMHISAPPAARPVGPGKFGDRAVTAGRERAAAGRRSCATRHVTRSGPERSQLSGPIYLGTAGPASPASPPQVAQDPQEDRGAGVVFERAGGAARLGAGGRRELRD
jgi:hypothetical protein